MINNNNNFGNFGMGNMGMGVGYAAQNQQPVVMNQTLSKEEIDLLRKKAPKFNFKLSKEEFLRAICTHKDPQSGNISLHLNPDGTHTCAICSETFTLLEPTKFNRAAIEDICANFNDLFQTIKTMYGPVPAESGRELYAFIGFIPRMADLYEISSEYFNRLNSAGMGVEENKNMYSMGMLNTMMNPQFPMGMNMGGAMGGNMNMDPQYAAYLQQQQIAQQQAMGGNMNMGVQQNNTGMNVATYNPNPGVPNPAYAPQAGAGLNPIGYVEENQTVQAGPSGYPQADVKVPFKG